MTLGNPVSSTIRSANPDDAHLASQLTHLSMGELADYLFGIVHLSVDELLAGLFSLKGNRFSWNITDIVNWNDEPAGMLVSFPGWEITRRNLSIGIGLFKLCGLLDLLRLAVRAMSVAEGIETYRDEYYVSNLAVFPALQGRGIGSFLLAYAEDKAQSAGLKKCSLIVDTENPGARRLYERCGYQVVFTKTYTGPAAEAHAGYHRMVKELN
jgi:ribosomal protein S18 acetylase RimI-like enzyme